MFFSVAHCSGSWYAAENLWKPWRSLFTWQVCWWVQWPLVPCQITLVERSVFSSVYFSWWVIASTYFSAVSHRQTEASVTQSFFVVYSHHKYLGRELNHRFAPVIFFSGNDTSRLFSFCLIIFHIFCSTHWVADQGKLSCWIPNLSIVYIYVE